MTRHDELEMWVDEATSETQLTRPQAEAFYRLRVAGQSREDAAAAMDCSKRNVDKHDGHARREIIEAEKLVRLAEKVGWSVDVDTEPVGGGSTVREFVGRISQALAPDQTDPAEATLEDIAAYCGIDNPETVREVVPVDEYREGGGVVKCAVSSREPYPPETIVAKYPLPDGGREVLSGQVYADLLGDRYGLTNEEAKALAYARAGWSANELHAVMASMSPGDVLQSARGKLSEIDGED